MCEFRLSERKASMCTYILITLINLFLLFPLIFPAAEAGSLQASRRQQTTKAETLASLQARIKAHISQPKFTSARWGIKVVSLDTGKTLFSQESGKYSNPASNAKLFTCALALDRLGPDYRMKTSIYSTMRPDANGLVKGDLIIFGRGDPTIGARFNQGNYYAALEPLVSVMVNAGVKIIEGDLIGDDSYFRGSPLGSGWQWDDLQWYYGAEVSALSMNDNAVDLFVNPGEREGLPCRVNTGPVTGYVTIVNRTRTDPSGTERKLAVYRPIGENIIYLAGRMPIDDAGYTGAIAIHNPAGYFLSLFEEALKRKGIVIKGKVRTIDSRAREFNPLDLSEVIELGSVQSPRLADILRETMKPSSNLMAQLLLLQVGVNGRKVKNPMPAATIQSTSPDNIMRARKVTESKPALIEPDPQTTTEELAIDVLEAFLAEAGIKKGEVLLEEGAGLSRKDMVTPDSVVQLLSYVSRCGTFQYLLAGLPVAGVDGTLQNRMKDSPAAGNLHGKTGTLKYVNVLSGYVTTAAGERLAFSIMLNDYYNPEKANSARDDIDAIAIMLASFTGHT